MVSFSSAARLNSWAEMQSSRVCLASKIRTFTSASWERGEGGEGKKTKKTKNRSDNKNKKGGSFFSWSTLKRGLLRWKTAPPQTGKTTADALGEVTTLWSLLCLYSVKNKKMGETRCTERTELVNTWARMNFLNSHFASNRFQYLVRKLRCRKQINSHNWESFPPCAWSLSKGNEAKKGELMNQDLPGKDTFSVHDVHHPPR